ncbi:hypothetical protein MRBBS_1803 [Marinobacter sp. BSs20148]|nr:hypothetical protein MRBBS_1803 [Marinobacter sp. BSs20148]
MIINLKRRLKNQKNRDKDISFAAVFGWTILHSDISFSLHPLRGL